MFGFKLDKKVLAIIENEMFLIKYGARTFVIYHYRQTCVICNRTRIEDPKFDEEIKVIFE